MDGIIKEKERMKSELESEYYEWLTDMVPEWKHGYSVLLRQLYETPFTYLLTMDQNREGDGLGLRGRYVWEHHGNAADREFLKKQRPCSVLEVMIALALRFEEEYATHYDDPDPVGMWFGPMIRSLGLSGFSDWGYYDSGIVANIIQTMLEREYSPDGKGSLFYIPGTDEDMRCVEIWQQMTKWYTNTQ